MIHEAIRKIYPEAYLITGTTLDNIICKDEEGSTLSIDLTVPEIQTEIDRLTEIGAGEVVN